MGYEKVFMIIGYLVTILLVGSVLIYLIHYLNNKAYLHFDIEGEGMHLVEKTVYVGVMVVIIGTAFSAWVATESLVIATSMQLALVTGVLLIFYSLTTLAKRIG